MLMEDTTTVQTYQQIIRFAQQLTLADRVQLVRDILAAPAVAPAEQDVSSDEVGTTQHRRQVEAMLRAAGLLNEALPQAAHAPPLTEEQRAKLAQRVGSAARPLSVDIIAARKEC